MFCHTRPNRGANNMFIDHRMLDNRNQNRSTVVCQNGVVCSSQPLASMAGVDILKAGGEFIPGEARTRIALAHAAF